MLIVVTGASQGIGAAIAEGFAGEANATPSGVRLALLARSRSKLEAVAARCRARGAEAEAFVCDVTDEDAVARTVAAVQERFGGADVLVNNAGQFQPGALLDTDAAAFRQQVEVNLTSAFLVTHAFLPAMAARGRGHVFFMASVASLQAYPGGAAYCAAKHGLLGLARVVREETKPLGLRVTTLLPGATFTPSWDGSGLPPDRLMPPEDIAHAVVDAWRLSDRTVVEELVLRPQLGDL
ncbi:MAG: SDR family oxidoreductase [Bacteroidota bacterium]